MSNKSTFNKLQSKVSGINFSFKRRYNWLKSYARRKYIKPLYYIKKLISFIASSSLTLGFFLFFFYKIKILTFSNGSVLNNITNFKIDNFEISNLLSPQISMSLILVTLVSLVSSLDKKFIYGEKAIEQVFRGQGAFKIKVLYFLLLILPLLNILILINNYGDTYFIINFLITLCIVLYVAYRISLVYGMATLF